MIQWSKADLEEMCGVDITDQLAFLAGCFKHKLINDKVAPDGWIIPDESLRRFAELIIRQCAGIDFRHKVGMTTDQEADTSRAILEHFGVEE